MVIPEHINDCSFCGKSQKQVQDLVAGPGNIYICNECIDLHRKALEDEHTILSLKPGQNTSSQPETPSSKASTKKNNNCSFCGKTQDQVQYVMAGPGGVYICNECIALNRERIEKMVWP